MTEKEVSKKEKPPKKPRIFNLIRLNSGRGGFLPLRNLDTKEIRFGVVQDYDLSQKIFTMSEKDWNELKGVGNE